MSLPIRMLFLLALLLTAHLSGASAATNLAIHGNRFMINGSITDLYGIRVASASQTESYTQSLIDNLDAYKQHGVNAVAVYFQGSSGGFSDPFSSDGKALDAGHLQRMNRIIKACDEREMIVVVGIFYQRTMSDQDQQRRLADNREAVRNATATATAALKGQSNLILNIANEQNSRGYAGFTSVDFNDPEQIIELCELAKSIDPARLVGGGGYDDESNVVIGRSPAVDTLLFDTFAKDIEQGQDSGWHYDYFVEHGVTGKPIVNVELYGGWTRRCVSPSGIPGYYTSEVKSIHFQDIDAAVDRPGLSVFLHSNPWCQGPSDGFPLRYDLGGDGTAENPGIRWYFEYVRNARAP